MDTVLEARVDATGVQAGVEQVNRHLDKMSKKAKQSQDQLKRSFDSLKKNIFSIRSAVLTGIGGISFVSVIREASAFETKMKEVSTLLEDTSGMEAVTKQLQEMSIELGAAPIDQAGALYQVISAGASDSAEAMETLRVANQLAIGGVTDVTTAADGLTSVLNAYGMEASEAINVSDAFFVAMKAGKTTVGELASSIGLVAPLAVQAGVSVDEMLGSVSALTKGGIKTSIAIRGMRQIMAQVIKPTEEAAKLSKQLGLEFNVAALQSKGLAGFLKDVKEKTGGSTDALAQLFGAVEAVVPVLALAGQAGEDFNDIMGDMQQKSGETATAVDKIQDSFDFKLDQFTSSVKVLSQELGTALFPALSSVVEGLTDFVQWIRENSSSIAAFAKIVGAGGALVLGFKALTIGALALEATLIPVAVAFVRAATSAETYNLAQQKSIASTYGAVKAFGFLRTAMLGAFAAFAGFQIGTMLREQFQEVRLASIAMVNGVMQGIESLKGGWEKFTILMAHGWNNTIDVIQRKFGEFVMGLGGLLSNVPGLRDLGASMESFGEKIVAANQPLGDLRTELAAVDARTAEAKAGIQAITDDMVDYELGVGAASDNTTALASAQKELVGTAEELATVTKPPPPIDEETTDQIKQANSLLKQYQKELALASDATEAQKINYELTAGELQKVNGELAENLRLTSAQVDANKLMEQATQRMEGYAKQTALATARTEEQRVAWELSNGSLMNLNEATKEQVLLSARQLDDAKFTREADRIKAALDPTIAYNKEVEYLHELYDRGALTRDEFNDSLHNTGLKYNETARVMKDSFGEAFRTVISGTGSVKDALGNMVDTISDRMFDLASQQLGDMVFKSLFSPGAEAGGGAFSGLFSGGGGGGGGFGQIANMIGSFFGGAAHGGQFTVPSYANGGDFRVGGSGGVDSQLVAFKATPNEQVTITNPRDKGMNKPISVTNNFNITAPNGQVSESSQQQIAGRVQQSIALAQRRTL